ncbi:MULTISPECIES: NAD-glutamate dehydrogenase [Streptomyces]|uniref:NAD-glutamate dehydrogenase n=1 Tax=Streptomyces tsukubensis (strain DSM 42081 / NBRC 108919 / NRRL 18488 / 9993) TaxID=1114943 RepID=I2MZ28_STRT9|nr:MULTISPECIES: NAD-glutamate dehydrogenase [Streptomyces]AZK94313.1 NAD-glutamate dehydrogenase [Streptomyces tsukubensis]EIF90025.1 NAD-glutamate dehydrogenase [Streptomyces tsukubensis NRRL18488]MYS64102.1 NAD-glutamate dehydrogenase [Streptomyces sp. SID5473]QKM69594.1 NAD-glutamate dehydrogenase [Streptomyces tsukubensis NRRL18488]TAI46447.1 NAD-glutamate dehydrogenase [Streptomyces tsukubensis]
MQTKLDEAKAELLARAARVAENGPGGGHHPAGPEQGGRPDQDTLLAYLQRYYLHTAPEDLTDRDPVDVFGAALSHYRLAENRPQGTAGIRVHTPTVEENGWTCSHSVVEVVTDDMPFLVDSVTNELSRQGRGIHVVIHPQVTVRRDVTGKLLEVLSTEARSGKDGKTLPHDTLVESWIHVEIDRETDRADLKQITVDLLRVLSDVREAVEDWEKMRDAALRIADDLTAEPVAGDIAGQEVDEARELLRWLAADHFTFLGFREYELTEGDSLAAVAGTGLGILRSDPHHSEDEAHPVSPSFSRLPADARAKAREHKLLVLTKANSRSTVHRPSYLDYVGVKKFDVDGNVIGERRFLGLFSSAAYTESVRRVPVIRRKVAEVLDGAGFSPNSHDGRDLLQILETYPRDELFQTPVDQLRSIVTSVLYLQERRRLRLYLRQDEYGRYYSALVYLPRDRYTTGVRLRLIDILKEELGGTSVDFTAWNTESILSRIHFVVRVPPGTELPHLTDADTERIEARLVEAARSWADGFADALNAELGEERAAELLRSYGSAFPEGYKADHSPRAAVADLVHLDDLTRSGRDFSLSLYEPVGASPGERRFKIYRAGEQVSLSAVLPVLQQLGCEVVDERPYELRSTDRGNAWIYDFGLRMPILGSGGNGNGNGDYLADDARERFQDAFAAVWTGDAENDGFNALVLRAGLTWRQAMVLRAYAKYLRQAGATFSQEYMENTLRTNVHTTRLLVSLFEARMSPGRQSAGTELTDGLLEELDGALDQVASLDEDRILRSFLTIIKATLRTNFFQHTGDGGHHGYVSMKFDPQAVPDLPAPRPAFEIWVYSPRVEGVHLRFGKVARGGLRWSDRREDFRTEILGLVKAQMVKNTVIVPVGAKGGFVAKQLPDPAVDRDAWLAEGIASYRTFISALLDITDNLVAGEVVPPADVVRHDEDDTYLVVAADKGTASFSDIANEVAVAYDFWLGDAFASGGSAGYDHKGMGITARGAWESVKRHFRELGHDTQTEDFTVVGVGDMSGDVFGNGMLLSEHIRLIAAFDHRHIFIDPDPDAAVSYAERRRMFELPRSSWADYDSKLLSPGGGVHPRTAKSIPVNAQMRDALGIEAGITKMTPAELMKAVLQAPVDLLWNGGIGTYVKASAESDADVGDKANDAIRVNGDALRVKVVGEGGNLGLTQLGRIEFARSGGPEGTGGRVNTDAIDNSAGVDTSDHEVNIKILLNGLVADGDMTVKQRNALLARMTDEVGALVLRNNYAQNVALANAAAQAPSLLQAHQRLMRRLGRDGALDRSLEFLPNDRQIRELLNTGRGLSQPELAVLLAYTKITVAEELIGTGLPDDPYLARLLHAYFPKPLRKKFPEAVDGHALRREIITTVLVNDTVNTGGSTFLHRLREETGASTEEVVRAQAAAREIFGLATVWDAVEALDNEVSAGVQTRIRLHSRRLVERGTRWLLGNRPQPLQLAETVEFFAERIALVRGELPKLLRGADLEWYQGILDELTAEGVPEELAMWVAGFSSAFPTLDIVAIADRTGKEPLEVAEVYYDLADRLRITQLMDRIIELPRADRWQSMARASIREDLYAAHAMLTGDVLSVGNGTSTPEERFKDWEAKNASILGRARATLDEIQGSDTFDLANLSVAMRTMRQLLRTHS